MNNAISYSPFLVFAALASGHILAQEALDEIVVTSELRPTQLLESANSVTVLGENDIAQRNAQFLTDILIAAPNINYSSGASRGHFFQIRGIGERSQFIDPLNPGVGLMIDGIDYSTLGAAATLFDIQQIEILRGPQGTSYGANALAGLISMQSAGPTEVFEGAISGGIGDISGNRGNLDSWQAGLVISGPIAPELSGRIAVQRNTSDGFIENAWLNRDDTQNIDELTLRAKLNWQASEQFTLNSTLLRLDQNNGYDSFNLDNQRETISDQPGEDNLNSWAIALNPSYQLHDDSSWQSQFSWADSRSVYSYDEDWTNPEICTGTPCAGWEYMSFDQYNRNIQTSTVDSRLLTHHADNEVNWVAGVYGKKQRTDLDRDYTFDAPFSSHYQTTNLAVYGSLGFPLTSGVQLDIGMRLENFQADYRDNRAQDFSTKEAFFGGHISMTYPVAQGMLYGRIARGYKAGGVNGAAAASLPNRELRYTAETLWNYELGFKRGGAKQTYEIQMAAFYQDRRDAQVKQSYVICAPICSFTDYLDNAALAHSYGLETEFNWHPSEIWMLGLSFGLLKTEFDQYQSFSHINATPTSPYSLAGEEMAQSPTYQVSLNSEFLLADQLSLWLSIDTKDSFRFSNRHWASSKAYSLLNARLSWQLNQFSLSLWGSNLTNVDYATRGFGSFNNDPRDFYTPAEDYLQYGDPRQLGITMSYQLQ